MSQTVNQTKYGEIKAQDFTTDQWNHGYKIIL